VDLPLFDNSRVVEVTEAAEVTLWRLNHINTIGLEEAIFETIIPVFLETRVCHCRRPSADEIASLVEKLLRANCPF
jgi:hypothetical protein